jgi:ribosome modulation factor
MEDKDKKIDPSSEAFQNGYKAGYTSEDRDIISGFFHSLSPKSDNYQAGEAEGERDRMRDDHKKEKK